MTKKAKYDKPIEVNMEFDEMMQRLSKVDKTQVEKNIKQANRKKK